MTEHTVSPLAGIEQMLRDEAHAMPLTHARRQRFMERADYIAGMGKVLEEWREAHEAAVKDFTRETAQRWESAQIALLALLSTPTSPREPRGKEKE